MKFIFFNLVAVIAILYLVTVDGKPMKSIPELINQKLAGNTEGNGVDPAKRARKNLENFKANLDHPIKEENKPDKSVSSTEVTRDIPGHKSKQKVAVLPQTEIQEVPVRAVNKVPEIKLAGEIQETQERNVQKLISRAERRRELNRLARDMEMMFADKLAQ